MKFKFTGDINSIQDKFLSIFADEFFGLVLVDNLIEPQIGALNQAGECALRDLTQTEQVTIQAILEADYTPEILVNIQKDIIAHIERVFARLSCEITGEPEITPLMIAEWEEKERLFYEWIEDGQPQPAADNEYSWAFNEAEQDPVHTGFSLLEEWGRNAIAWRSLQKTFAAFRQAKRAAIAAATTESELQTIKAEIEPQLRTMFGV